MSGALKHFFDTIFLEAGGALSDDGGGGSAPGAGGRKPYGLWVHGRYDTTGAVRSVQSIVQALPWPQSAPVLEVLGEVGDDERERGYELGGTARRRWWPRPPRARPIGRAWSVPRTDTGRRPRTLAACHSWGEMARTPRRRVLITLSLVARRAGAAAQPRRPPPPTATSRRGSPPTTPVTSTSSATP